jgi:N-acyl homoserine lactone hydrolase
VAGAGETIVVPAGVRHSEANPGSVEIEGVVELRPGAAHQGDFTRRSPAWWPTARPRPRGAPKNPLQLGATFWHFRHESRVTSPADLAAEPHAPAAVGGGEGCSACALTTTAGTVGPSDPIRRVSLVSTGHVQIRPDHVASTWRPTYLWLLTSRKWTRPRPINAYVIEHREGLVLFDTGQDRASVTETDYFPGGITKLLYDRLARFEIGPEETLSVGLNRLGYAVGDVRTAIVSHLHQDHIGGLPELGDADIIVSKSEWDTLSSPLPEMRGLMTRHIDLPGLRWQRVEPEATDDPGLSPFRERHDLFGDGSLVLLPTPGHTPGSMSLLVRQSGQPPFLLVGDLTYDVHVFEKGHVPGVGSRRRLRESTAMVNQLRRNHPDLVILPAHDPGAADRLAQATGQSPATISG